MIYPVGGRWGKYHPMSTVFFLVTGAPAATADQSVVAFNLQLSALSFQPLKNRGWGNLNPEF
jgi:hypothetical protein